MCVVPPLPERTTASTCPPTAGTRSAFTHQPVSTPANSTSHSLLSRGSSVMHFSRKYVPTRCPVPDDSASTAPAVHVRASPERLDDAPERTWPPPGARMRVSKANKGAVVVKAVRRHPSPQPVRPEAAWSDSRQTPESLPSPERRNADADAADNGLEGHLGGGPVRGRKRGFRPPDVRTIFSAGEKDPRVKQEFGEGHNFEPGGENTWCDLCCRYIFQQGLTCAGKPCRGAQTWLSKGHLFICEIQNKYLTFAVRARAA